jgi:hypothetical protein
MTNIGRFLAPPVRSAVVRFMTLMGIAVGLAAAEGLGLIDQATQQQAMGLLVGAVILVVGNLLPKMRPLAASGHQSAEAAAAERLAGWLLVLAGLSYLGLFLLTPLAKARPAASLIGLGALLVIAVSWTRLALASLIGSANSTWTKPRSGEQAREQRKVVTSLLFAMFYLLTTACLTFLFRDQAWFRDLASLALVGFCIAYVAFSTEWCTRRLS